MVTINTIILDEIACHRTLLNYYLPILVSEEVEFAGFRMLESHDASSIKALIAWVYTGAVVTTDEMEDGRYEESEALAKLWVSAYELRCTKLCNRVMARILDYFEDGRGGVLLPTTADFVVRNTCLDSKLRLFFYDIVSIYSPLQFSWGHEQDWDNYIKQDGDGPEVMKAIGGSPNDEYTEVPYENLPYHCSQRGRYLI